MDKRRILMAQLAIFVCFMMFVGKLFWIQVAPTIVAPAKQREVIAASVRQRVHGIVLDPGRGHFYDTKGRPLTGYTYDALAIFPVHSERMRDSPEFTRFKRLLQMTDQEWETHYDRVQHPIYWRRAGDNKPSPIAPEAAEEIQRLQLPGVALVPYTERYLPQAPAMRLLGFIGQNPERLTDLYAGDVRKGKLPLSSALGVSGLEKTFDRYLRLGEATTLTYFKDAGARPIRGLGLRIYAPNNPFYPLHIQTTIDIDIQMALDDILRRYGREAVTAVAVVLDANTGDVVAMGDSAQIHPTALSSREVRWVNPALKAVPPGSIFKTVIAAAALDADKVALDETFYCSGKYERYGLACWKQDGHGHMTLADAYAHSCNVAFARLSERLTSDEIAEMAHKLGLTVNVGWQEGVSEGKHFRQFDAEESGVVFVPGTPAYDGGVRAQTAIGQRDVKVTPLGAANMIVALINGGRLYHPRVVSEIKYRNGARFKSFTIQSDPSRIRRKTAQTLLGWMERVVESGTGARLQDHQWSTAGKSGTAQTVVAMKGEGENEWFVGYVPAKQPRFAVAVLIEKQFTDPQHQATTLYGEIVDMLKRQSR